MTAPGTREVIASGILSVSGHGFDRIVSSARFADYIHDHPNLHSSDSEFKPVTTHSRSTSAFSLQKFVAGTMGAMLLVLCLCSDDIVWLLPFLDGADKPSYALFYIFTMVYMWFLSASAAFAVQGVATAHPETPIGSIVEAIATVVLMLLSVKLFMEWYYEEEDDNDDEEKEKDSPAAKKSYTKLFFVALAGNLDNVGVYIPILLHGVFTYWELLMGDLFAAIIIAAITLGLSQLKGLMDVVTKIPLWMIVGTLTCYVGATALVDMQEA